MTRRDALKRVAAGLALPAWAQLPHDGLLALGRTMHRRIAQASGGRYIFKTLDARQSETVAAIAEMIIPETDTPGAIEAGVCEFIDLLLTDFLPPQERDAFLRGLARLDRRSAQVHGRRFADCPAEKQAGLLEEQEREAASASRAAGPEELIWGRSNPKIVHFFQRMKWATLMGYYTSSQGMLDELGWSLMPGAYEGCKDESPGS